ncbi:MAG: tryptophan 2,3-dioxygenase [Actinomycetota bacterium]|nr:tryptophan 2,3-dioxygenase [Actinomycetota bacterium]
MSTAELTSWLQQRDPKTFPYDAVVCEYRSVGKHFVSAELLDLLSEVRALLPGMRGPWPAVQTLAAFLRTALDKPDGRYDYPTYLALAVLQLPTADDPVEQAPFARSRCDRMSVQLMSDMFGFELAALDGRTTMLPNMRPEPALAVKRFRLGARAVRPALARLSLDTGLTATESTDLARQVCAVVRADMSVSERLALDLSVLPVYTAHDEYMFLRVLQLFETAFSLLAVQLRGILAALAEREVDRAVHFLANSEAALRESAPLFSMLATMQVEAFRTFRAFTEGASAIQSRNYKIVESLCRTPDESRSESAAYLSVPEVRARVLAGQQTLDDAHHEIRASGDVPDEQLDYLAEAMRGFARAMMRWRQTHYRIAVRMLGEGPGTGYTEGTPYLASVRNIPVFNSVDVTDVTEETDATFGQGADETAGTR